MTAKLPAITVDPELVAILEAEGTSLQTAAREHLVLDLYRQGSLSDWGGARLLGMGLEEFIRWAGERGVPYMRYPASELEGDVVAAMKAALSRE